MKNIILFLIVLNLSAQAQNSWKLHIIDNSSDGADGVKLADINNDGQLDITTGWEEAGLTKIYLHPKTSKVKEKWPVVIIGKTPHVEDAVFADMNNDGKLDVVSCTESKSEKIFVHFNQGESLLNPENWKQEVLPASDGLMMWMYAEPLQIDNRNGIDLVAAGKNENAAIGWFEAPVNTVDLNNWKWHEMSPAGWVMSIFKRDMDNDGDIDIVISDRRGELRGCRWLENPGLGKAQKQPWKNHFIGAEKLEIMFMSMTDLNGDGVEEAVICERSKQTIKIFTRLDKSGIHWKVKSIQLPASTGSAKSVEVGDINNDGINDLVVSTNTNKYEKNGLIWLNGKTLTEPKESDWQNVSGIIHAKYDKVELIDLDEDGDLDVLICEENNGEHSEGLGVVWYENQVAVKSK